MSVEVLDERKGNPPYSKVPAVRAHTFTRPYRFRDLDGNPLDISGSSYQFEVRVSSHQNKGPALIAATEFIEGQSAEAVAAGVAADEVLVKISDDDMDVVAGDWPFGFTRTDPSGDRIPYETGIIMLSEDIPRK